MAEPLERQESRSPQAEVKEEDVDASIQEEIIPVSDQPPNLDGATDVPASSNQEPAVNILDPGDTYIEPRIAAKKDATLREFMGKMDEYAPIIPDAVTNHYLALAGLPPPPQTSPHLARLLALATQKFISDIAADAYQYARIRTSHTTSNTVANPMGGLNLPQAAVAPVPGAGGKEGEKLLGAKGNLGLGVQRPGYGGGGQGSGGQSRTVLTMEDLGMAVGEYGVNVKRGEFYR